MNASPQCDITRQHASSSADVVARDACPKTYHITMRSTRVEIDDDYPSTKKKKNSS